MLLNWCVRMEQVSWQKGRKIAEYEAVKLAVADFMGFMDHGGKYEVFYDKQAEEMLYTEGEKVLSISDLNSGYQSLIWMVFDIAFRIPSPTESAAAFGVLQPLNHFHDRLPYLPVR